MFSNRTNTLLCSALIMGAGGMIGQLVLIRTMMVVFYGNEFTLAMTIAAWLFFEGAGARLGGSIASARARAPSLFVCVFILYSFALPITILSVRCAASGIFGLASGQAMGLAQMSLTILISAAPAAILHGSLFPLAVHLLNREAKASPAGLAYLVEIAGAMAGGLVFVFTLATRFTVFQVVMALLTLHLLLCWRLTALYSHTIRGKAISAAIALAALISVVLMPRSAESLHRFSLNCLTDAGELKIYRNSPYGNISVFERDEQHIVFYDGRPIISLPHPDTAMIQDYAWLAALSHDMPRDVLLLGGGLGGLLYHLLEHPLDSLIYTEQDPYLPGIARQIDDYLIRKELDDPRVKVETRDGRLYLNRTDLKFDLIIIGAIGIDTLQANRFFTEEFFRLARGRMNEGGVLAFSAPGSPSHPGKELAALNACLYRTALSVFEHVLAFPGEHNIILASDHDIELTSITAGRRLADRGLDDGMFAGPYIEYRLDPERMARFSALLAETPARINQDFEPAGFFHQIRYWSRMFAPRVLDLLSGLRAARHAGYGLAAAALILLLARRLFLRSPDSRANRLVFTIGTSGVAAMALDIFTLFAFQSLFGYIYQLNGLFIAAFMGGMFTGAWTGYRHTAKKTDGRLLLRRLRQLDASIIFLLIIFYGMIMLLRTIMEFPGSPVLSAITAVLFALVSGSAVGAQFPVAIALMPASRQETSEKYAGRLYAADLSGGCIGGLAVTIILFPMAGMARTLLLLAIFKLLSFALLALSAHEKTRA